MTTDRELLELAAKGAGYVLEWHSWGDSLSVPRIVKPGEICAGPWQWNPLNDEGDALRLAIKLHIDIITRASSSETWAQAPMQRTVIVPWEGDEYAATRRAIVRAAAEIGMAMP